MQTEPCVTCLGAKAPLRCGLCAGAICKRCAQFLDDENFSFLAHIPEDLAHGMYCTNCFDSKIAPELEKYNSVLEQAKEVQVFLKKQAKESRLIERLVEPVNVQDCKDEKETLLRLAFFAAQTGHNALVDVEIKYKKIKTGTYQTHLWNGVGIPAHLSDEQIVYDRSIWDNPN